MKLPAFCISLLLLLLIFHLGILCSSSSARHYYYTTQSWDLFSASSPKPPDPASSVKKITTSRNPPWKITMTTKCAYNLFIMCVLKAILLDMFSFLHSRWNYWAAVVVFSYYSTLSNKRTDTNYRILRQNLDLGSVIIFDQWKWFRLIDLIPNSLYEVKQGI